MALSSHSNSCPINSYSEISTSSSYKNSSPQISKKNGKHPNNAVIVNFINYSQVETITIEDVKRELAPFGSIRSVQLCSMDACQAFVTFQNSPGKSARKSVSRLLKATSGMIFVENGMWTVCRPETWKKVLETEKVVTEETTNLAGQGITVDELSEIFANFIQQNSSVSQSSYYCDSAQSFSSFSSMSLAKSCGSSSSPNGESCDSFATIVPFSFYPAQRTSGFINLPPPYHTLPNTAFFRRTRIVPPPPTKKENISLTQKIMNCYINSIRKGDSELGKRRQMSLFSKMELECNWSFLL